jgi:hypothetical protein
MHETINLGTPENPKNINLGKTISKEEEGRPISNFSDNIKMSLHGPTEI